jgi:hypothetical protein
MEGHGTLLYPENKKSYSGTWNDNTMHGYGTFTWNDGRKYVGEYVHDKKHGRGRFLWADGKTYDGPWVNGVQHGVGSFRSHTNATMRRAEYADGKFVQWIDN